MKRSIFAVMIVLMASSFSFAQFKGYDDKGPSSYKTTGNSNLILGFFNPNNFTMNHSFNVSMVNSRYGNVSLTSYINSMNYRVNDRFNISADVKLQYSPFASSGLGTDYASNVQKNLSGLFLSRASLNYRISDNSFINVEYRRIDESDYINGYYNPFNSYNQYRPYGYYGY